MSSIICFLSTIRAGWHLYRHNYAAAARIYEFMLERDPGHVRLYLRLSYVYFQLDRRDERAMKTYQAVLKTNNSPPH